MDRRRFLTLFGAASSLAAFNASGHCQRPDASIWLSNYDLQFRPPENWASYDISELADVYPDNQVLSEGATNPEPNECPTPLFAFSREKEPVFQFNPQVIVYGDTSDSISPDDLLGMARFCHEDYCEMVDDVATLQEPTLRKCNSLVFATARLACRFENTQGLRVRAVRHVEIVSHGDMLYAFMLTNQSGHDILDVQAEFIDSIRPIA